MSEDLLNDIIAGSEEISKSLNKESEDLAPLLEEIDSIEDSDTRLFVRGVLLCAPDEFWTGPSSINEKFNPPDEHSMGGNIIHTKRVVRVVLTLAEARQLSPEETDTLLAAALIHDLFKIMKNKEGNSQYDPMHPYMLDRFITWLRLIHAENSEDNFSSTFLLDPDKVEQILRVVRCHMGAWSAIPETLPFTNLEWILHYADLIASRLHTIVDPYDAVQDWRWMTGSEDDG